MDSPSTQVLDDNDSSSSRSSESLQKTPKRVYQVATLTVGNKKYPIFEGINKVGRHLDNDICINDHNVSMYHAEIEADAKHAFICDLRSTNKTRMNDEKLKPDRFYQLLDGTKLTFGILNGTYLRLRDDESIIIPSTPEPGLKLRRESNKNSSRPNTSSTGDSDDSVVLGTQETPEAVFVKPLVPNRTINSKDTSNNDKININESDKSIYDEETQRTNKSIESQSFIHECATQKYDSKQSGRKNITTDNRQKAKKNIISVKSEIFDKETQKYRDKNNDTDESQISTQKLASEQNDQVYDAETQKISVNQQDNDLENAMTQKFNNKKIYDIETQKRNEFENQDNNNVYNMATQRFQPLNIRKEKTEIYDAETQQSKEKSIEMVAESDEEHEQDKVPVTDMVLRSNKNEEIMTTNKKVCINNISSNNKSNNASQNQSSPIINEIAVENIQNSSTLIPDQSCLIVAETDDESETDDEGVFSNFLQKEHSNGNRNINITTNSEVITDMNLNNENINNDVHLFNRNFGSPVLVDLDEISESLGAKNEDNIVDDSDNEMYMTPNQIMSPTTSNLHSNIQVNSYNNEAATQRIVSPTLIQMSKKNFLAATQSIIATQVLIETQKVNLIERKTYSLETQIIDTQVREINDFESPERKQVLKLTTQSADTQILETQKADEFSENNDEENNKGLSNNYDNESTQLIEFENDTMTENMLEEQEIQIENEINNDCDINEKPLKTLRLKKNKISKNCAEWRISSSCKIGCNDDRFQQESQEISKIENNDESNENDEEINHIKDENGYLSQKKIDNKDQKYTLTTPISMNKINLSLNQSTKNRFKNKKDKNQEIHTSNYEDNDVVLKHLDSMFGEVAYDDMVEPTQLLTQQLVDILKTPEKSDNVDTVVDNIAFQKFGGQKNGKNTKKKEKETLGNYSRVDGESQELYFAHLNFKRKRKAVFDSQDSSDSERSNKYQKNSSGLKNDEPCLSGFVDGIAIVCERLDCQGLDETINHKETNDVNDDILTGLPEVNLNGAGFSPRSHASLNSSDEDIPNNEKKVLEQPKMISKSSGTKKLVLSIQCDNKINDNDEVNRKKTKIATVKLSQYDKKEKSSENSGKLSKSDEQIELDQKRIKKTPERKGQMNQSQVSKPELNSEVITSGYNSSSESKEVKIHEKRKAICDVSQSLIDSKKKKPVVRLDNSLNISLRQESKRKSFQVHKYCVIFTGINPEDYIESIKSLGGTVTDEPSKATVLVTDKVRRTYKFICAISRSIPIVSIKWIDECIEKDEFLDTDKYILKDDISEIKFDFKLSESLKKSSEGLLLLGYTFIITPKIVNPSIKDLKDMIQVAGGKSLIRMPRLWIPNTVIVGCDIDIPKIKEMVKKIPKNIEVPVVTTEFILSGILKQKLEPEVHKLY
ncbi:homeobox protein 2-like isoform X2 [Chelonus insularis]|uniref:homeobox protein 2-like isoform X2 n=1 Tax=Chelonus insularis TaxID=460826 RepID=UPI001588486D|nr:homeobox protein 2-like isoform X2 [Chelonus insularis]